MAQAVFCLARTEPQARTIVTELKNAGFRPGDISVLFPDKTGSRDFAHASGARRAGSTSLGRDT